MCNDAAVNPTAMSFNSQGDYCDHGSDRVLNQSKLPRVVRLVKLTKATHSGAVGQKVSGCLFMMQQNADSCPHSIR